METQIGKRGAKRVSGVMKKSLYFVFFVILVLCGALIGRLVYLNNVDGDKYAKAVLSQQSYSSTTLYSERGRILDRNGVVLAGSRKVYNVIIDPAVILSRDYFLEPTLKAVELTLGYDSDVIRKVIEDNAGSSYVVHEENIDYSKVSAFNAYRNSHKFVEGIWFEEEYERVYPYGSLASHVIGFTTDGKSGSYGIEQYYNDELSGTDGLEYGYFDAELNSKKTVKDAINGNDIVSTIDYNIQKVVEEKVSAFIDEVGCKNIGVIVMAPNNAEILAMASNKEFDLNNPGSLADYYDEYELKMMPESDKIEKKYSIWRNFCISDAYEPGSTFKTITVASALEEDCVTGSSTFECEGYRTIGGWKISCNNIYGHGTLTLAQSLMKSCNCALMDIAAKLGPENFYKDQLMFGFGKKTGVDLPGETAGQLIDRTKLHETELATSSFGTTFTVNMLQVASAYASIINGGTYYKPHVVKKIVSENGITVSENEGIKVRQTVCENTSEFIRNALYMTVEDGTATPAKVEGYIIGGKTGTAQKRPREEKKYVVSFCGFAPVNNPRVMAYIVIDEISDPELAGSSSSATKMFSAIMKEILPYLGLYPDGDIEYSVDLDLVSDSIGIYDEEQDEKNPDVLPFDIYIDE